MTAYEELKAWCEKHLDPESYKAVPESPSYCATIYFINNEISYICFDSNGAVFYLDTLDEDDMIEHIQDYERTQEAPKSDPMPTTVGGQMVRKMIEFYERQAH